MKVEWQPAADIKKKLIRLIKDSSLDGIKPDRIKCYRSRNSKTHSLARIWGLSRIWQQALNTPPYYLIEVITEKFDRLSVEEQEKVLLHELAHIPSNFSGALLAHSRKGKKSFHGKLRKLYESHRSSRRKYR